MKQIILTFLLVFVPIMANADDSGECGNGLTYLYDETTHTLTISKTGEGTGAMNNYEIVRNRAPWDAYATEILNINIETGVTSIGDFAFQICLEIKSVKIPEGVTTIGKGAFTDCYGLQTVVFPESLTSIGEDSFCSSELESLTIPKAVTSIGKRAFLSCLSLNRIIVQPTTPPVIGYQTFPDYSVQIIVPNGCIETYKNAQLWSNFLYISDGTKYKLSYILDGKEFKTIELLCGDNITPEPYPTKEGYTFLGWSDIPGKMPNHNVTITGTFNINSYKLTYMIDDDVYKEVTYEYGATITPEQQPEGNYETFEWTNLPQTMPAHDVVVHASYTTGIVEIHMSSQRNVRIFSPNGKKRNKLQKGLNIVILDDGTVHKIWMK